MMPDREKVVKGLECCCEYYITHDLDGHDRCPYNGLKGGKGCNQLYADALALLKEQEEKMEHLNNITLEYEKEVFRLQTLLKEQEALVRCKDCKHRPIKPNNYNNGLDLEFPDGECPCLCIDGWYSWYPADNWFCANGERK